MTENKKILAFENKLKQLKEEESLILKLLKDVQKQMKKYAVEELQTCSDYIFDKSDDESDSDGSIEHDPKLLLQVLDSAELINDTSLNLGLNTIVDKGSNEEESEEESDD